jgi:hypothetical protein
MIFDSVPRLFLDRNLRSRMPLVSTPACLKLFHACGQWHSSRVATFLPVDTVNDGATLKDKYTGKMVDALTATGMWSNTLIVYASDNGAVRCPFFLQNCALSGIVLGCTPLPRLKRCHACDQWHVSRVFILLPVDGLKTQAPPVHGTCRKGPGADLYRLLDFGEYRMERVVRVHVRREHTAQDDRS